MILFIDNYDSFTYNLVQYFSELNADIKVFRNDKISLQEATELSPSMLVISPGPSTPKETGICLELIKYFTGRISILGVCLGHQSIGYAFGARIINAQNLMHGKTSTVSHTGNELFNDISSPFTATRYHSLVIEEQSIPDCLEIIARSDDDKEIMAIKHKDHPIYGVQFHPESILTQDGKQLVKNILKIGEVL